MLNSFRNWLASIIMVDKPTATKHLTLNDERMGQESVQTHDTTVVAYDEELLENTKTKWLRGEWEELAKISKEDIRHHPDRAKIVLFVAAAHAQLGNDERARTFTRLALDWGCSKKQVAQVMISGAYNSLAKVAYINNNIEQSQKLYEESATIGKIKLSNDSFMKSRMAIQLSYNREVEVLDIPLVSNLCAQKVKFVLPKHGICSYAQNFEDVILWRALGGIVKNGFYIDVGAFDPVIDSVSKAFYENGWRGVHVEPLQEYAEKIRLDRPDEKVYECILASRTGIFDFYELYGLSTGVENIAISNSNLLNQQYKAAQRVAITLCDIFNDVGNREIHWIKIDVEGMESEVLSGWGNHHARPWIVVVEATVPLSSIQNWEQWDFHLTSRGYVFAYFDGLNRYYVHELHQYIVEYISMPPMFLINIQFIIRLEIS